MPYHEINNCGRIKMKMYPRFYETLLQSISARPAKWNKLLIASQYYEKSHSHVRLLLPLLIHNRTSQHNNFAQYFVLNSNLGVLCHWYGA